MNKFTILKYTLLTILISILIIKLPIKNDLLVSLNLNKSNTSYSSYKKGFLKLLRKNHPDKNEDNTKYLYWQNLNSIYFSTISKYKKNMRNLYYLGKLPFMNNESIEDEIKLEKFQIFFSSVFKILLIQLIILSFIFYSFNKTYKIIITLFINIFFILFEIVILVKQVIFLTNDRSFKIFDISFDFLYEAFPELLNFATLKEILNFLLLINLCLVFFMGIILNIYYIFRKREILSSISYRKAFIKCVREIQRIGKIGDRNEKINSLRKLVKEVDEVIPEDGICTRYFKKIIQVIALCLFAYAIVGK